MPGAIGGRSGEVTRPEMRLLRLLMYLCMGKSTSSSPKGLERAVETSRMPRVTMITRKSTRGESTVSKKRKE